MKKTYAEIMLDWETKHARKLHVRYDKAVAKRQRIVNRLHVIRQRTVSSADFMVAS